MPAVLICTRCAPASDSFWAKPLNQPDFPLASPAYQRGAMLLQALRNRVGSTAFAQIMRAWTTQHRHGNASTADFEALAATISGQSLGSFFSAWVDAAQRPAPTNANGFPPAARAALYAGQVTAPASAAAISRSDAMIWRARASSLDS